MVDIEELVEKLLDMIEEADVAEADELVIRFNKKQIHEAAEAYREVERIEIY